MEEAPLSIKHIVISGGGGTGLAFYGVLRESNKDGFWKMSDIQTMHATSIGTFFMLSLPIIQIIGWDSYEEFIVKRPWEKVFELTADLVFQSYGNVGMFGRETFEIGLQPLLAAVDLSLNTTLLEFYEFSGVEMHWYITNLDKYCLEDVSYKTHPNWTIMDATYCSCALPIMFRPGNVNGVMYSDGGTLCSYPIAHCVQIANSSDEIFGIWKKGTNNNYNQNGWYENILDYLSDMLIKTIDHLGKEHEVEIKNSVCVRDTNASIAQILETAKTPESRMSKINQGRDAWNEFWEEVRSKERA